MSAVDCSYQVVGTGPAVYMVHGIGARKETWNEIVEGLKDNFTCVIYDLRGHGESPIPATPYTLEQLVEDLEKLRNKLGHQKIHIIGHSLGGMIGPAYARAYPQRVLSLGLFSTAAGRTEEDRQKLRAVGESMQEKGVPAVLNTFVDRWYTDKFIEDFPDKVEMRLRQVRETPSAVFMSVFWVYATTEMAPWLHEINCPCLIITGENDGGCNPRLNRYIDSQLADSTLVILETLKHSIIMEASDQILNFLEGFLLKHH